LYIDYQDTDIDYLPQSTFTPNGECGINTEYSPGTFGMIPH
jgi:hypothetical protein